MESEGKVVKSWSFRAPVASFAERAVAGKKLWFRLTTGLWEFSLQKSLVCLKAGKETMVFFPGKKKKKTYGEVRASSR